MRLGRFTLPWPGGKEADPYWEAFLKRRLHDPRNAFGDGLRRLEEGNVFPVPAEVHSPEVMAAHVKELARFLGAPLCGIVRLAAEPGDGGQPHGFAIVTGLPTAFHPDRTPGMARQVPVLRGAHVTFFLAAYIRELGFRATAAGNEHAARTAAAAGLPLTGPSSSVYLADVVLTDLPMAPDRAELLPWPPTS